MLQFLVSQNMGVTLVDIVKTWYTCTHQFVVAALLAVAWNGRVRLWPAYYSC